MKKLLILLVFILFIFAFIGCSEQADTPAISEEIPPTMDIPSEPSEQTSPTPASRERGVIVGDILYKGIPISQLFTEPFLDILGEPIAQHGAFFYYEGLEIMGDRGDLVGHDIMAIQLNIDEAHLGLFELNGVSFDMTRRDLIAAFGAQYSPRRNEGLPYSPTYRIFSPEMEYTLRFQFSDLDSDTRISSISIFRPHQQERWDDNTLIVQETTPEQLVGIWENALDETYVIPHEIPQGEHWVMTQFPNGTYRITVQNESPAHYEKWFFPVGADMVRYGSNWSLVPSDTSRARLFVGTFSITACCPDEEILQEVFYMLQS